ncbi:MAG: argininosuccinate lyase [Nitrospinae bacterium]|nr:argininosuccinate lyase [Nitrospinota bacterium]
MKKEMKKAWEGRFTEDTDRLVEEFTASVSFDKRLYRYDIMGSIAHCKMLGRCGILSEEETQKIVKGLERIEKEIEKGEFEFDIGLEDIHMNIERRLIDLIGDLGGKLHTGRSRNDQVALDIRLYLRDEIEEIIRCIRELKRSIIRLAKKNIDTIMPGYTHLQRAQPVLLSHHLLAYFEMLDRDEERYNDSLKRINVMPLGSAALAGTSLPIDQDYVATLLNFPKVTTNSIDSVSDRDFIIEFCAGASILMMHLSRLSEELILWSSSEFNFIEIGESFCTGSSIMPQKKNPDVPELVRGKTGRIYGNLFSLLTMMKSLPLAYNRDMQEDKISLFDTVDTVKDSLSIYSRLLKEVKVNKEELLKSASKGFTTATDMADYLVEKGLPFREAHKIVGEVVRYCINNNNKGFDELTLQEIKGFSDLFEEDIFRYITVENSINRKRSKGGTSKNEVLKRIAEIE